MHPDECEQYIGEKPFRPHRISLSDVIRGTQVMAAFKLAGSPLVDQVEANRRAALCVNCPLNMSFSLPCGGVCSELKRLVTSMVGQSKTKYDERLHACCICHCFLHAAVWLPLEIQCLGVTDEMKEHFKALLPTIDCWKQCP